MHVPRRLAAFVAVVVAAATVATVTPGSAFAADGSVNEVASALSALDARNTNLVADAAPSMTDGDSAAQTQNVDVPADPTKGVVLKQGDRQLKISLPGAQRGDRGTKTRSGAVVYGGKGASLNVVVPTADGSLQLLTHIRSAKAAEDYRYCVDGVARFEVTTIGAVVGYDRAGQPVTFIPPPTATEQKTGKSVPTTYKVAGNCLVQHVAHKAKGTSYPVVADPSYRWYSTGVVITLNKTETGMLAASLIFLPVVAGLASIGSIVLSNKVMWKAGWFQAQAAWFALHGQCLWIWVPYIGESDSGGYPCS